MHAVVSRCARIAILAVALLCALSVHSSPAAASATAMAAAGHSAASVIARVYQLINDARAQPRQCGTERFDMAPPLTIAAPLQQAAAGHAAQMARWGFFDHTGRDGTQPRDRLERVGYHSRLTGENIAFGPESAEEVVAGWLASPGHCANIMDPRFRTVGVAFSIEPRRHAVVWVQDLAWPR